MPPGASSAFSVLGRCGDMTAMELGGLFLYTLERHKQPERQTWGNNQAQSCQFAALGSRPQHQSLNSRQNRDSPRCITQTGKFQGDS